MAVVDFDYIYSAKPGFFHEESNANLFEVEPESGKLINTDNGTPMAQVSVAVYCLLNLFDILMLLLIISVGVFFNLFLKRSEILHLA